MTRRRKRGAATVVEGYDRAAVERGDPSIPADQLAGAKSHFALLDVIEAWFPQSKLKLVEFGVHTTVRMPESECVANRISLAQHTRGPQLGAWFQGRERDAISNFRDHFHKANASWLRIARPLRALYDEKALTDERVEGGTLTEILSRLDIFFDEETSNVLDAVEQTVASSSNRERWGTVIVVDECRNLWTDQKGKPPALVARFASPWSDFLEAVFKAMGLDALPETATKAWKRNRVEIRAFQERGGRIGPEIIVILPAKSVP